MKSLVQKCVLGAAAIMFFVGGVAAEPARFAFGGRGRTYIIERPPGQTPSPTVVMLHGFNGTGADIARSTAWRRKMASSRCFRTGYLSCKVGTSFRAARSRHC